MTYKVSAIRTTVAEICKSLALSAPLLAGALFVASPVLAQGNPDPGDNNEGCGKGAGGVEPGTTNDVGSDFDPGETRCKNQVPAPLAAAGIPALAALGAGYLAVRRRRREDKPVE